MVKTADNTAVEIEADYIILAMGIKPDGAVTKAFEAAFDRVIVLGESRKSPGRIATSVSDGYIAAFGFDPDA